MKYAIAVILAATVGMFASVNGFEKERSFYPVVLIVIATYYILLSFAGLRRRPNTGIHC